MKKKLLFVMTVWLLFPCLVHAQCLFDIQMRVWSDCTESFCGARFVYVGTDTVIVRAEWIFKNRVFPGFSNNISDTLSFSAGMTSSGLPVELHIILEYGDCAEEKEFMLHLSERVQVYPSVLQQGSYLTLRNVTSNLPCKVRVLDFWGREHLRLHMNTTVERCDVSELPVGPYIVVVSSEVRRYDFSKRIVIVK